MILKAKDTIEKFNMINPGEHVVVGVSGGADSVALLLNLVEYQSYVNYTITVVHINHLIRDDAKSDAKYVEKLCHELNLPYLLYEIDIKALSKNLHMSEEEAGRKARYDAMFKQNPDKIAVGHHMDDLAETVILNMCRGSGIHGISGISPVNGNIIRPFIYITRKEIEKYLDNCKRSFCTDSTNLADEYARNRIRHNVLPLLNETINSNSVKHIANLANDMQEVRMYINKQVDCEFEKISQYQIKDGKKEVIFDKSGFNSLDSIIKREIILKAFEKLTAHRKDITRNHINSIIKIFDSYGEKYLLLPYNLELISSYNDVKLKERIQIENDNKAAINIRISDENNVYRIAENQKLIVKHYPFDGSMIFEDIKYTKRLDYDKIKCSLVLRNRQPGDYIIVNDNGSKKSLKEYFINEKIPRNERDKVLLLADGSHILWIIGYRISAGCKIKKDTRNIIEVSIEFTN